MFPIYLLPQLCRLIIVFVVIQFRYVSIFIHFRIYFYNPFLAFTFLNSCPHYFSSHQAPLFFVLSLRFSCVIPFVSILLILYEKLRNSGGTVYTSPGGTIGKFTMISKIEAVLAITFVMLKQSVVVDRLMHKEASFLRSE
jgi:hypothetical protein